MEMPAIPDQIECPVCRESIYYDTCYHSKRSGKVWRATTFKCWNCLTRTRIQQYYDDYKTE